MTEAIRGLAVLAQNISHIGHSTSIKGFVYVASFHSGKLAEERPEEPRGVSTDYGPSVIVAMLKCPDYVVGDVLFLDDAEARPT